MQEIISITTGGQGSPVVSARELHRFLEVRSKFADWIKNRIIKYSFTEGTDYIIITEDSDGFSKNLEKGGRPELDYALTLDMAKELAMVERNEKGKEARLYFIEKEKQLNALNSPALSTEQILLQLVSQQTQLLAENQQMLSQLRSDVDSIMAGQRPAKQGRLGKQLNLPGTHSPSRRIGTGGSSGSNLRSMIHQRVVDYCAYHNETTQDAYRYLYKQMLIAFGVDVYRLNRIGNESMLDVLERYGQLDRLYSLVMAELNYSEDQ